MAICDGVEGPVQVVDRTYSVRSRPWELHVAMAEPPSESWRHWPKGNE